MKAAHIAGLTLPADEVIKAGEFVQASFVRGVAPSATARKTFALLIHEAAGDAWKDGAHSILKRDLRGTHNSNDRLDATFDELQRTLLRVETRAPDGRSAILVAPVIAYRIEHPEDDDQARIWWQFSEPARQVMQASDVYAALNRSILLAFESRYAVTLYERGCLLVGRHNRRWRGTVAEFREMMGVPSKGYRDWFGIRSRVLDPACAEVNQLAQFTVDCKVEHGPRQKIIAIELTFQPKDQAGRAVAATEIGRSRVGRKERRAKAVATFAQPDLLSPELRASLDALKENRDPPGASKLFGK